MTTGHWMPLRRFGGSRMANRLARAGRCLRWRSKPGGGGRCRRVGRGNGGGNGRCGTRRYRSTQRTHRLPLRKSIAPGEVRRQKLAGVVQSPEFGIGDGAELLAVAPQIPDSNRHPRRISMRRADRWLYRLPCHDPRIAVPARRTRLQRATDMTRLCVFVCTGCPRSIEPLTVSGGNTGAKWQQRTM